MEYNKKGNDLMGQIARVQPNDLGERMPGVSSIGQEPPIFFKTVEEFCVRPGFVEYLICKPDDLDRIIGKYERLNDDQILCSLNGCNQKHMYGYVIATKDGREGNCGKDCGHREFGITFNAVEAQYKAAEDAQTRRRLLDELLASKNEMLVNCKVLHSRVKVAAARVLTVVTEINREPALARALASVLRIGGAIRVENKVDAALRGAKADLVTIGEIKGGEALRQYLTTPKEIYYTVILGLERLDATQLASANQKELEIKTREIGALRQVLIGANAFLDNAASFCANENMVEFAKLKALIPRSSQKSRLDRVLSKLPTLFAEVN